MAMLTQLKSEIQSLQADSAWDELKLEIADTLGELSDRDSFSAIVDVPAQSRVVASLKSKVKGSAAAAYAAIEDAALKSRIKREPKAKDKSVSGKLGVDAVIERERTTTISRLGFMLRSPLVTVVKLPYRLGVNVWLFVRGVSSCLSVLSCIDGTTRPFSRRISW
jgi:hypothetical protein